MGTNLQEVINAFLIKFPGTDFSDKIEQVIQIFKSSLPKCRKHTYDNLEYTYHPEIQEGYFYHTLSPDTVELIAIAMAKEYSGSILSILSTRKQYLGTQAFNKIPNMKEKYDLANSDYRRFCNEFDSFKMEFPDYTDER